MGGAVSHTCSRINIMAARTDGENASALEQFHPKCGGDVKLSDDRRVASGPPARSIWLSTPHTQIAFSNAPIPRGLNFSVKVLQEARTLVSQIYTT